MSKLFLTFIALVHGVFALETAEPSIALTSCVSQLIQKLFPDDVVIHFVSEDLKSDSFPLQIHNPRITINSADSVRMSWNLYNSYVIYTNGHKSLNEILKKLKSSSLWNRSETPRGKFLIVTSSGSKLKTIFEVLWSFDIINAIVIENDEKLIPKLYTSDPFEKCNKCANEANVVCSQLCDANAIIKFNQTMKNLNGCPLKVLNLVINITFKESAASAVMHRVLLFIGKILNTNKVEEFTLDNKNGNFYNHTEGILFAIGLTRGIELMTDYDLSEILFHDRLIWAVPKANKIYGLRVLANIYERYVWITIGITLIMVVVVWWLMAKHSNDRIGFRQFWRSFVTILAISLCGSDNLSPKTKVIKCLAIFYSVYCMLVDTSFNANLSSVLTKPLYDEGITTVEALAESGLTLLLQGSPAPNLNFRAAYGERLYKKLQQQFIYDTSTINHDEALKKIILHRNLSDLMSKTALQISGLQSEVGVLDAKLITMECTFYMRKGHYFMSTFNKLLGMVYEHGFYEEIMREAQSQSAYVTQNSITALDITHLSSVFTLWGVGLLFATVLLVVELLHKFVVNLFLISFYFRWIMWK